LKSLSRGFLGCDAVYVVGYQRFTAVKTSNLASLKYG